MSTSGISSAGSFTPLYNPTSSLQQTRSLFQQLSNSLQSGNLPQAQQAFTSLAQDLPANAKGPFAQDFQAIGQALRANDLQGAQQAFAKLQSDFQAARGQHHHHHHGQAGVNQAAGNNSSLSGTDSDGDNDGSGALLNVSA
ncbi:MAG: hypothetical protein KGN76_11310 [Acidobacteriota bacterium]|nr:hypothetical protein [Acidobacteriota bacterium]